MSPSLAPGYLTPDYLPKSPPSLDFSGLLWTSLFPFVEQAADGPAPPPERRHSLSEDLSDLHFPVGRLGLTSQEIV